jgi:2-polyprenyl-6-methoxyphenol hydroxylase-like FAD-dependent oxidoreductase
MKTDRDDIVIAGGGIAGFAAAIGASSSGRRVIILEKSDVMGGNATRANVGTICGAFYQYPDQFLQVGYPFTKLFVAQLAERCGTTPMRHNELVIIPYEWSTLQVLIQQRLSEHSIEVMRDTAITAASATVERLTITTVRHGVTQTLEPHAIIDCSGNAAIASLLGFETLSDQQYQAASQVFRVNHVTAADEYSLAMSIKRAILQLDGEQSGNTPTAFDIIPGSLRNGAVDIKLTLPDIITDETDLDDVHRRAVERIQLIFPLLTTAVHSLSGAAIVQIFPQLGVRVLKRSKGKVVLSEDDIIGNRRCDDALAIGTWPMEERSYDGKVKLRFPATNEGYDIPAHCLQSVQSPR